MKPFRRWLNESFGEDHKYSALTPHHSYKTADGHDIDVHVFNNVRGKHAVFFNKDLNQVTKLVHWSNGSDHPSKADLEKSGYDSESLHEEVGLTPDSAGKIAELSATIHMLGHKHKDLGTYGTDEHHNETRPHEEAIAKLSKGKDAQQVGVRVRHGQEMANAALEAIRLKHGPDAKIVGVGHTSKPGDIGRFTQGKHNDTQENPSDIAVQVKNSTLAKSSDESHYEGFSLKSSSKSNVITAKNPAIDMKGMLDHKTRVLDTEKVSRDGLQKVHKQMGYGGVSAANRARILDSEREKKPKDQKLTDLESMANEKSRAVKTKISTELHDHLSHLTTNLGQEGHNMIGKMLQNHLTPTTSMPWSKVHAKGDSVTKVRATVTPGSESPLNQVFKNKNSKYAVTQHGDRVSIHKVERDGSLTTLAHYSPKTKSNAFKSDVHGWNVVPAKVH